MRANASARVQVKAAGGVRDLDGLIRVRELGATATAAMLDEFRRRASAHDQPWKSRQKLSATGSGDRWNDRRLGDACKSG